MKKSILLSLFAVVLLAWCTATPKNLEDKIVDTGKKAVEKVQDKEVQENEEEKKWEQSAKSEELKEKWKDGEVGREDDNMKNAEEEKEDDNMQENDEETNADQNDENADDEDVMANNEENQEGQSDGDEWGKLYSLEEVTKHATADDCWFVIDGQVYDVTSFISAGKHPWGTAILQWCGKDATELFKTRPMGSKTPHSPKAWANLENFEIGALK